MEVYYYAVRYGVCDGDNILTLTVLHQVTLVKLVPLEILEVLDQKGREGLRDHQGDLDKEV